MKGELIAEEVRLQIVFLPVIVDEGHATLRRIPPINIGPETLGISCRCSEDLASVRVVTIRHLHRRGENVSVVAGSLGVTGINADWRLVKHEVRGTVSFKKQRRVGKQTVYLRCSSSLSNLQVFAACHHVPAAPGRSPTISNTSV